MPGLNRQKIIKLNQRIRVLTQEVSMFQQVMKGMRRTLQEDALLKIAANSIRRGMGLKRCGVFLVEPEGTHVRLALGTSLKGRWERGASRFPISRRRGFNDASDIVFGYKKYLLSNNFMSRYKEGLVDKSLIYNMAVVPIHAGPGRAIGYIGVDNLNHYRHITLADVAFLTNYAQLLGLAIQSARNHEQAVTLSVTDPLTGLSNRRFFEEGLAQEIKRCQRYHRCFSLILADIDRFKKINDTYGHDVGDEVIRHMARILRENVRSLDMVARIGGEEFAILLPETPPNNLSEVIRRTLQKVRQSQPSLPASPKTQGAVTLSLGVAGYKKGMITPQQIFKLADKSLYQAKRGGRNRCGPLQVFASNRGNGF
jgi:diguanylate cyclase (GGDEF)-like protein